METSLITGGNNLNHHSCSKNGQALAAVRDFSYMISSVSVQLCWNSFALVCAADTPKQQFTLVFQGLSLYPHCVPSSTNHRTLAYVEMFQFPSQAPEELPLFVGFTVPQHCHLGICHMENANKANTDAAGNVLGSAKASFCSLPRSSALSLHPTASVFSGPWRFALITVLLHTLSSKDDFTCQLCNRLLFIIL